MDGIPRICIDCEADIQKRQANAVRCEPCQKEYRRIIQNKWKKRHHRWKKRYCENCGKDITRLPNRATWCKECRRPYLRAFINRWRRENRPKKTPLQRFCKQCDKDISDRHYLAKICLDCRKINKKKADRRCYERDSKARNAISRQYYRDHKEAIIKYQMNREKFLKYKKNIEKVLSNNKLEMNNGK